MTNKFESRRYQYSLQDASCFLFQKLYKANIVIAPTCIFDEKGRFKEWLVFIESSSKKKKNRILRRRNENVNLLVLQSDWMKRKEDKNFEYVCNSQASLMPKSLNCSEFKKLMQELGQQEAEIRFDTYSSTDGLKYKGPFLLQGFIPPKNDTLYVTTFAAQGSEKKETPLVNTTTTCMSNTYVTLTLSGNPPVNSRHDEGYGIKSKLRNVAFKIAEYLHLEHGIVIVGMTLHHILDKKSDKLILIGAENIVWTTTSKVSLKNERIVNRAIKKFKSEEKLDLASETIKNFPETKIKKENLKKSASTAQCDMSRPSTSYQEDKHQGPLPRTTVANEPKSKQPFIPSSVYPQDLTPRECGRSKLWKSISCNLDASEQENRESDRVDVYSLLNSDNALAVSKKFKTRIIQTLQRKLFRAIDHLEFLVRRTWCLERTTKEDEDRLREYDLKVLDMQKEYENLRCEFNMFKEASASKMAGLEKTISNLETQCDSYSQQLSAEHLLRTNTENQLESVEAKLEGIIRENEILKAKWDSQEALDARLLMKGLKEMEAKNEEQTLTLKWQNTQKNDLIAKINKLENGLNSLLLFKKQCFTYLCDLNTPGVNPPARKGGGFSMYPNPGPANVKLVVKALVDGYFRESSVSKMLKKNQRQQKLGSVVKGIILKNRLWPVAMAEGSTQPTSETTPKNWPHLKVESSQ